MQAGYPTLEGCMAWWRLMTNTDPRSAVAYILYLGFDSEPASLVYITKPRRQERKAEQRQRTVYKVDPAHGSCLTASSWVL